MSRTAALSRTLRLPTADRLEVISVPPTGDCLYDCLDLLLPPPAPIPMAAPTSANAGGATAADDDDEEGGEARRCYGRPATMADSQAMRDLVSSRMTQSLFDNYRMYAAAGVEDYAWMNHHHLAPSTLEELREFAKVSGREAGAGRCLWADEHALRTVSDEAGVTLLIVDEQATTRRGNRSGRRRRGGGDTEDRPDGRFVAIGNHGHCLLLRRSRRQHYDAVVVCGRPTMRVDELPPDTRSLWPTLSPAAVDSHVDGSIVAAGDDAAKEVGDGREAGGGGNDAENDEDADGASSSSSSHREASSSAPSRKKARGAEAGALPASNALSVGGGATFAAAVPDDARSACGSGELRFGPALEGKAPILL